MIPDDLVNAGKLVMSPATSGLEGARSGIDAQGRHWRKKHGTHGPLSHCIFHHEESPQKFSHGWECEEYPIFVCEHHVDFGTDDGLV